jgi:hypothetical protein
MHDFPPARLGTAAASFDAAAARMDADAAANRRVAADPTETANERAVARAVVLLVTRHADDYRATAAALRDGHVPDGIDLG